jgi:hypothetical protein
MHTSLQSYRQKKSGHACALLSGIFVLGLALAAPAAAGMGAGGGGAAAGAGAGGGGTGAGAGAGASGGAGGGGGGAGGGGTMHHLNQTGLATCPPGMVWDAKHQKCPVRHGGVLPDSRLTEEAFPLARADRLREVIDGRAC